MKYISVAMSKSLLVVFVAASILENISSSGATCNSTVCSTDGETNAYTVQSRIAAFLDNQSQVSVNATQAVLDSIKQFILSSKFDLTNTTFQIVYETYFNTTFDEFYAYLVTVVETRERCRLHEVFQRMFYNMYMSAYFVNTGSRANSTQFQQCSYEFFVETNFQLVNTSYANFALSFDRLVLYLRALGASSTVLQSLPTSSASTKPCASALARISNCSMCLGTPGSVAPCDGLCTNVLRGCLVDLAELVGPFQEYAYALADFKNSLLRDFNPWDQITLLQSTIFRFFTSARASDFSALTRRCNPSAPGGGGKRDVPEHAIARRTAVATPSSVINMTTLEIAGIPHQLTLLSGLVCSSVKAVTSNSDCWNGVEFGRYHHGIVQAGGKSLQSHNPEVVFCPSSSGSQYKRQAVLLKEVTQDLKLTLGIATCHQDDEDCVGSTSVSSRSCADLYTLPSPSNTTKRATPQHYDQSDGSGSGSGFGSGSDVIPVDVSLCEDGGEGGKGGEGTASVVSTVPPTTECNVLDIESPASEVTIKQSTLVLCVCVLWCMYF